MAVVPRYVAQQGLEVARAPNLQLDGSIGRQLQQLGATGEDVAMRWMAREEQKERFAAEQGLIRLSNDLDGQDQADAPNMAADGTGWRDSRQKAWAVRRTAFLNTVPEALKEEFSERTQTLGESYLTRAAGTEMKALGASSLAGLGTATNNLLTRTSANPASRRASEETLTALINTAPGLSNAERARLLASVPGRFDEAAAIAMVDAGDYEGALDVSGSPAGYFDTLRSRESGGRDDARAGTSSATGRYQFLGETWDGVAKSPEGRAAGLKTRAESETDPRLDPDQQEAAIRIFTAGNGRALSAGGFQPTERNLYLAHFLGDVGAVKMLKAINTDADQSAAALFPDAAKANKAIFYDRAGNARSVEQVYRVATRRFSGKAPDMSDADLTKVATADWTRQAQLRRTVMSLIEGREADARRAASDEAAKAKAARAGELAAIAIQINDVSNGAADPAVLAKLEKRLLEIGNEIGLEDVQTEMTALGDARAKSEGAARGDELAAIAIQINDAGNKGDVAALAPLEARLDDIGKSAGAKAVETQMKALSDARAKAEANSAAMADVAGRLAAGGLDATDGNDRKYFDMLFQQREAPALAKLQPAERNARIAAIAARAGIVPDSVIKTLNGSLMAGGPAQQLEAADLIDRLGASNRALVGQVSKDAERKAGLINFYRQYGEPDPVGKATEALKVDAATLEARDQFLIEDAKEKGPQLVAAGLADLIGDDDAGFGVKTAPPEMTAEYNRAVQAEYRLTGRMEWAIEAAKRQVAAVWGRSAFSGDDEIVAYAPEKFFGQPDMDIDDNAAWMREQAEADVAALGAGLSGESIAGRLTVMRHPYATGTDGKPVYLLLVRGDDNSAGDNLALYPVRGADGQLLEWRPDWASSPEGKRRAAETTAAIDVARRKRAGDPGAGRSPNAGKMGGFR